eukprot:TRINITY_DN13917_c0_g1_i2.p1 TRINITY_DN13917_c0_g1~~TRINITY_DN13917_c0_g1_i2.p1  ORF type:complete len:332 (+),score=68.01 TRINITY_DN13917_c0_g1_i2:1899-2894(+)
MKNIQNLLKNSDLPEDALHHSKFLNNWLKSIRPEISALLPRVPIYPEEIQKIIRENEVPLSDNTLLFLSRRKTAEGVELTGIYTSQLLELLSLRPPSNKILTNGVKPTKKSRKIQNQQQKRNRQQNLHIQQNQPLPEIQTEHQNKQIQQVYPVPNPEDKVTCYTLSEASRFCEQLLGGYPVMLLNTLWSCDILFKYPELWIILEEKKHSFVGHKLFKQCMGWISNNLAYLNQKGNSFLDMDVVVGIMNFISLSMEQMSLKASQEVVQLIRKITLFQESGCSLVSLLSSLLNELEKLLPFLENQKEESAILQQWLDDWLLQARFRTVHERNF